MLLELGGHGPQQSTSSQFRSTFSFRRTAQAPNHREKAGLVRSVGSYRRRGPDYHDHGMLFYWEDGRPAHPDTITRRFKQLAWAGPIFQGCPSVAGVGRRHEWRPVWSSKPLAASGPGAQQRQQNRPTSPAQSQVMAECLGASHPMRVPKGLVHISRAQGLAGRPLPESEEASDLHFW